ncbi:MAG: hypothetical protein CMO68_04355 [Verrucomicrobiales bacterium]|nr:hypothetical protein [Verrucomicrobiales bacterium]
MKSFIKSVLTLGLIFVVLGQESEAQENIEKKVTDYKKMAGLDLTQFTEEQQATILKRANSEGCDCGCKMTVAECRNEDSTCSKGARLAEAIIKDVTGFAVKVKLPKKKPDNRIGQPLDMKFTAVDGTKVDLAKMKGKVVLIDFWATWCGPCIAELPSVKKTYKKLNPKGFEIIGISLDTKESALKRFIKKENMPWPQFFDGKGWKNSISTAHGIRSIPAMWLVDKQGNLADLNARANLEQKVEDLLGAGD